MSGIIEIYMSEASQKFTIERREAAVLDALETSIEELYGEARNSSDLEAFDALYAEVALFNETLSETFSKEELHAVAAYHRLVRSGIPDSGSQEGIKIDQHRKDMIESAIQDFVISQFAALRAH